MHQRSSQQTRRSILATAAAGLSVAAFSEFYVSEASPVSRSAPVHPFRAAIPQKAIDDLRRRIAATRWPDKEIVDDRSQGIPLAKLKELMRHWGSRYDWRRGERRLNLHPQFVTGIDGLDIHFIHVRSRHAGAIPLVMTHGWPGSVFELLKTIGPLTDPTAHGGRAEDAFHLVLPSLPGYGFSGRAAGPGWGPERIATAWDVLMKRLGYDRYVAQGGDWGAMVTVCMARQAPAGLSGVHLNLTPAVPPEVTAALATGGPAPPGLSDAERNMFDVLLGSARMGNSAYNAMMTARPQTIGYGVTDSPAALAAWLLVHPGFKNWTYGEDASIPPSRDEVLDNISLYWLTNSAASAGRIYWENAGRNPLAAAPWKTTEISVPVAVSNFREDAYLPPETWVRRAYPNLIYFNEVDKGGHFAAWEQPELFSQEVRAAFRPLRDTR